MAEQAQQEARVAQQRSAEAELRSQQLADKLRSLGIDPDQL
ncbi:hypothetical protein [Synechococcus sp. PCC 7336]|nr:hypothetical protein [Synechococcus sp. PCC 7336]